jgi:hypothetical protein
VISLGSLVDGSFCLTVHILTIFHFPGNVFSGILNNSLFCGILISTAVLQVLIVQFGSVAFHVTEGGLDASYWGLCLAIGAGELLWQQVLNLLFSACQNLKSQRNSKRLHKAGSLAMRSVGDIALHHDDK